MRHVLDCSEPLRVLLLPIAISQLQAQSPDCLYGGSEPLQQIQHGNDLVPLQLQLLRLPAAGAAVLGRE